MAGDTPSDANYKDFMYPYDPLNLLPKPYPLGDEVETEYDLAYNLTKIPKVEKFSISTSSRYGLGSLDSLPLELLQIIIYGQLDLVSLFNFRAANRKAYSIVENSYEHKAIMTHAPQALRGIQAIDVGKWNTLKALYDVLCTWACEICGNFGGYLYLVTCTRLCFHCFTNEERYEPYTFSLAAEKYNISEELLRDLPQLRSVPGIYTNFRRKVRDSEHLVDQGSVRQLSIAHHGSEEKVQELVDKFFDDVCAEDPTGQGTCRCREVPPYSAGGFWPSLTVDRFAGNSRRFMAIVDAPQIVQQGKAVEWGYHCKVCRWMKSGYDICYYKQRFTEAAMKAHVEKYKHTDEDREPHERGWRLAGDQRDQKAGIHTATFETEPEVFVERVLLRVIDDELG